MSRYILCIFSLLITFAVPVRAETTLVPSAFVAPLMRWVSVRMSVPVQALPAVYASRERMIERIGDPQRQSALARALYVPGEVVIDDQFWDAGEPRVVSFLVHELVHHAQLASGRSYACHNAKEWEAYKLQNLWLAEHGLPPAVEEKWITTMADCNVSYVMNR
ncbi:MAG: hypothetical protein K2Q32_00775 [Alphaproteobacteria bacterium]|nr:hypothetical protein [Alphaproteobacteria bacterium]